MKWRDLSIELARLRERVDGLDRLTDAKFVTFQTLVDSQADKVGLALDAAKEAITKAETATEKRFDSVNEFRQTLSDQTRTFMPRTEAEQGLHTVIERMEATQVHVTQGDMRLDERLQRLEQQASNMQGRLWALGVGVPLVILIVNILMARLT